MSRRSSHVLLTLGKELRETLRDRRTLAVMVLFPLVVYPLLSLLVAQVAATRARTEEARRSRVAVEGTGPVADEVVRRLAAKPEIFTLSRGGTAAEVEKGSLDALVLPNGTPDDAEVALEVLFDATRDESREAEDRVSALLGRALPDGCTHRYAAVKRDVAPQARLGGYLLSKALPLALVLMVVLGAFYPAIDVTAGERERGTLETILSSPIRRYDLLFGKVLAVALLASATGVLNLASMSLTLIHAIRMADPGSMLPVPWSRAAAATLVILPSGFLFGAVFVAVGSIAKGFKEAQNLLMPVYLLAIAPALVGAVGEYPLSGAAAIVPAMNVTLLARELLLGRAELGETLAVLGSTAVYGCLALAFAARLYASEAFLVPGKRLLRAAWKRDGAASTSAPVTAGEALLVFGLAFVLLYFVFVPLQRKNFVPGLLASQWGGMLGLVVLFARATGRRLGDVLGLGRPTPGALVGAALIGASAWAAVAIVAEKLVPVPKEVIEQLRRALAPGDGGRPLVVTLFLVALTPAICEEALFRGPILRGLASRLAPLAAAVTTGLLFGIFHLDVYRLLPSATLGVLLSLIALGSGSILPAMLAHGLNNAILVTLASTKLDERLGTLGTGATVGILSASLLLTSLGAWLLRRSARTR